MRRIWILTLFPQLFEGFSQNGVIGRFFGGENAQLNLLYLGDYSPKNFKGVDAPPYGGGAGVVIRADVLEKALEDVIARGNYGEDFRDKVEVVYTSPRGEVFNNCISRELANEFGDKDYVFICGRYEGIDERFINQYVDRIFSLGDFVLSGGELAVMTIIDSFLRFVPSVLGNNSSAEDDSFEDGLIECPQYTRPADFNGESVPDVLLGGHHKNIEEYRLEEKLRLTKELRPDLYKRYINKDRNE